MTVSLLDFENKYKPIINKDNGTPYFQPNDPIVKENIGINKVWNAIEDKTIMKIVPNKKQIITLGMCVVTEKPYSQNDIENLRVIIS